MPPIRRLALTLLLTACRVEWGPPATATAPEAAGPRTLWLYTSLYQEVVDDLKPRAEAAFPRLTLEVFQSGSEKVAQRFEAEQQAGGSKACLLATSDPGWYASLTERELLRPYVSPAALQGPRAWVQPTWAAFRVGLMVLASKDGSGPKRFSALTDPEWKDRFSSGDPLSSGTTLTTVAAWERVYGEAHTAALRANGWVASGGNSAVLGRLETGERPFGVILLENLLLRPGVATPIFPEDGAIAIPGPLAIAKGCPDPRLAEAVADYLMGAEAQAAIVRGGMHSPFPGVAPPNGAPALADIALFALPDDFFAQMGAGADALKARLQRGGR